MTPTDSNGASDQAASSTFKILVATDIHLGYNEHNEISGNKINFATLAGISQFLVIYIISQEKILFWHLKKSFN